MDLKTYWFFKYFIIIPFFKIFLGNRCLIEFDFLAFRSLVTRRANATLCINIIFFCTEICSLDAVATT